MIAQGSYAVHIYWVQLAFHLQTCAMMHAMRNRIQETQHAMRQDLMVTARCAMLDGIRQDIRFTACWSVARCSTRILRVVFLASQQQQQQRQQQHAYSAVAAEVKQSRAEQSQIRAAHLKARKLILSSVLYLLRQSLAQVQHENMNLIKPGA